MRPSRIAPVVAALMLGLPAFGAWSLCQRVYYAYDDARGLFPMLTAMSLLVAAGTLLVRMAAAPGQWVEGAALATSASYELGVVLALVGLRRRLGHGVGVRQGRGRHHCEIVHIINSSAMLNVFDVVYFMARIFSVALSFLGIRRFPFP